MLLTKNLQKKQFENKISNRRNAEIFTGWTSWIQYQSLDGSVVHITRAPSTGSRASTFRAPWTFGKKRGAGRMGTGSCKTCQLPSYQTQPSWVSIKAYNLNPVCWSCAIFFIVYGRMTCNNFVPHTSCPFFEESLSNRPYRTTPKSYKLTPPLKTKIPIFHPPERSESGWLCQYPF